MPSPQTPAILRTKTRDQNINKRQCRVLSSWAPDRHIVAELKTMANKKNACSTLLRADFELTVDIFKIRARYTVGCLQSTTQASRVLALPCFLHQHIRGKGRQQSSGEKSASLPY